MSIEPNPKNPLSAAPDDAELELDEESEELEEDAEPQSQKEADDQEDLRLWQKYKQSGDSKVRDQLILKYSPFVKYVAGRMARGFNCNIQWF